MTEETDIHTEIRALIDAQRSLHLATRASDGEPEASYAPFVSDADGNFYIFVSELTRHTRNLLQHPRLSVLLIEPEADASQVFARRRVSYECVAEIVDRDDPQWQTRLEAFEERFGPVIEMLRGLTDFYLFRLVPQNGRFVKGFGQAYTIDAETIEHISADRIKSGESFG